MAIQIRIKDPDEDGFRLVEVSIEVASGQMSLYDSVRTAMTYISHELSQLEEWHWDVANKLPDDERAKELEENDE